MKDQWVTVECWRCGNATTRYAYGIARSHSDLTRPVNPDGNCAQRRSSARHSRFAVDRHSGHDSVKPANAGIQQVRLIRLIRALRTPAFAGVTSRISTSSYRCRYRNFLAQAQSASATALPRSTVLALPPMSGVRGPSTSIFSIASMIARAASAWPRCSSIIAPDQICPIGLATPLP